MSALVCKLPCRVGLDSPLSCAGSKLRAPRTSRPLSASFHKDGIGVTHKGATAALKEWDHVRLSVLPTKNANTEDTEDTAFEFRLKSLTTKLSQEQAVSAALQLSLQNSLASLQKEQDTLRSCEKDLEASLVAFEELKSEKSALSEKLSMQAYILPAYVAIESKRKSLDAKLKNKKTEVHKLRAKSDELAKSKEEALQRLHAVHMRWAKKYTSCTASKRARVMNKMKAAVTKLKIQIANAKQEKRGNIEYKRKVLKEKIAVLEVVQRHSRNLQKMKKSNVKALTVQKGKKSKQLTAAKRGRKVKKLKVAKPEKKSADSIHLNYDLLREQIAMLEVVQRERRSTLIL